MAEYLSLTDLFLVGLALDITGAVLLAKGLLLSPAMISMVSGTYWGSNQGEAMDHCQNRVDAEFGLGFLALGFLLQAVGYSLDIAGIPTESSTGRLLAGLAMSGIVAGLAVGSYTIFHERRGCRLYSEVEAATELRQAVAKERKERERHEREAKGA